MKLLKLIRFVLAGCIYLFSNQSLATVKAYPNCGSAVKQANVQIILKNCTDPLYRGNNLVPDFINGKVKHAFGKYHHLSEVSKYIKDSADNGNADHQFFWSLLLSGPFDDIESFQIEDSRRLNKEARQYRRKAADAGQTEAEKFFVNTAVSTMRMSGISESDKTRAIRAC